MQWLEIWKSIWKGPESRGGVICDLDTVDDHFTIPVATGKRIKLQVGQNQLRLNRLT